jgi:hypothetical protein
MGRGEDDPRWRGRGGRRGSGPGPLDVGDGGAHEPRDGSPPPRLHVERCGGNIDHNIFKEIVSVD